MEMDMQNFGMNAPESAGAESNAPAESTAAPSAQGEAQQMTGGAENAEEQEFHALRTGRLAPQFRNWAEQTFKERFKGINGRMAEERQQHQAMMQKYLPIMEALGTRYGTDPADVDGIAQRIAKDDSMYAEAASAEGMPVASYRQMKMQEMQLNRYRAMEQQREQEMKMQQHYQSLQAQEAEMQKIYPGFNLMQELQNPMFLQMTGPDMRIPVKAAYHALHSDEIQQQTINQTMAAASQAIQSGSMRPREAGMSPQQGQANPRTSPRYWSGEQRNNALKSLRETGILRFD